MIPPDQRGSYWLNDSNNLLLLLHNHSRATLTKWDRSPSPLHKRIRWVGSGWRRRRRCRRSHTRRLQNGGWGLLQCEMLNHAIILQKARREMWVNANCHRRMSMLVVGRENISQLKIGINWTICHLNKRSIEQYCIEQYTFMPKVISTLWHLNNTISNKSLLN